MRKITIRDLSSIEGNTESAAAARIFHHALDQCRHAVREIELVLADLNGPRGGVDKRCRARVSLVPRGMVVVEGVGENFLEALHTAADKAKRSLHRRLERRKMQSKRGEAAPSIPLARRA